MTELIVSDITVEAKNATLVQKASFRLSPGELVALLGPNGAGKTSLLRSTLSIESRTSGKATIADIDISSLSPMERAKYISYLPQTRPLAWPNLVRDVVALGRFAFGAGLGQLKERDAAAVGRALRACDLEHLSGRSTNTLSGGELARVHFARAFAAEAPLLIADEPVAALDPRHQFRIMNLVRDFVSKGGGALIVLHDIPLAARYADRIIWMKEGCVVSDGSPQETLSAERLHEVYGVRAKVSGVTVEIEGAS